MTITWVDIAGSAYFLDAIDFHRGTFRVRRILDEFIFSVAL